jgi:chromosome segregation ATPase
MRFRVFFLYALLVCAAAVGSSRSGTQRLAGKTHLFDILSIAELCTLRWNVHAPPLHCTDFAETEMLEAGQFPWMENILRNQVRSFSTYKMCNPQLFLEYPLLLQLNGLIQQRESLRRDAESAANQRREAEARKATADSKLAAASSHKSLAANDYNPVLQAEQKASAEHQKLQQQLVQVRADVDKFHRGVDAATAELKAATTASEANDKATEELQRDMAAASATLSAIHAAVQKIPEVIKRTELRKDVKEVEAKLKSVKQKVAALQAENFKATSKYISHEATESKGAASVGKQVTAVELLISLRQKQLAHLQQQLMRFRRAIQKRIKRTVEPLNSQKMAAEQRQATAEQQRQRVLQQAVSVGLLSNASDAELTNLQAAQTSLRNKQLAEQQNVRKAMVRIYSVVGDLSTPFMNMH